MHSQPAVVAFGSPRDTYLAIAELRRRAEGNSAHASGDLSVYELRVFSQNGEDGVLDEILRRIGTETRTFVEFGAGSGVQALCVYLADVKGWNGLFIEADPLECAALSAKYAMSTRVVTHHATVTPDRVEDIFDRFDVPEELDVLSIDIDGRDYWVWRAITRYRPRVVIIEYNAHLGDRPLTMPFDAEPAPWDGSDYFGASIGALRRLGIEKGYQLVHCDLSGVNAFFVRVDTAGDRFASPDEVVIRAPNYHLRGQRHPAGHGRWHDLGGGW